MFKKQFVFSLAIVMSSTLAQATVMDVCELANKPLNDPGIAAKVTQNEITDYQRKLSRECELSQKYNRLNNKLSEKGISLLDIAEYQAIRFVQRQWLQIAESSQKPVEIVYQSFKNLYDLPYSQQTTTVWDNWAVGVKQLEPMIEAFKSGQKFDIAALKRIHRGLFPFYPLVDEVGDFAHEPLPGVLKPTTWEPNDTYWWSLDTQAEVSSATRIVRQENETYSHLGLLTTAPNGVPSYVSNILDVREAPAQSGNGRVIGLFSGSSMVNRQNTELILNMVDQLIKQARQGQHMVWNDLLFTPGELAYFVQQAYVRVHPFSEGNGRTSRFLQELILQSFNLPHGASGDLMDFDALTENSEYYRKAIDANVALLNKMEQCASEYDRVSRGHSIRDMNQSSLSYGCRILADRSNAWAQLKYQNEVVKAAEYAEAMEKLRKLDQETDRNHRSEMARRSGKPAPAVNQAQPVTTSSKSKVVVSNNEDECANLSGSDKTRCERMAEIKKKLGVQ